MHVSSTASTKAGPPVPRSPCHEQVLVRAAEAHPHARTDRRCYSTPLRSACIDRPLTAVRRVSIIDKYKQYCAVQTTSYVGATQSPWPLRRPSTSQRRRRSWRTLPLGSPSPRSPCRERGSGASPCPLRHPRHEAHGRRPCGDRRERCISHNINTRVECDVVRQVCFDHISRARCSLPFSKAKATAPSLSNRRE